MPGRIKQRLIVVLAMDVDKIGADLPHDGSGGRPAVDAADAFAVSRDLAVEQQRAVIGVAAVSQLRLHSRR